MPTKTKFMVCSSSKVAMFSTTIGFSLESNVNTNVLVCSKEPLWARVEVNLKINEHQNVWNTCYYVTNHQRKGEVIISGLQQAA